MPNDAPVNFLSLSLRDYAKELSTTSVNIAQLASVGAYTTAVINLQTAIGGVTDGVLAKRVASLPAFVSSLPSAVSASHREKKILVRYSDNVDGRQYSFSIPTRDDAAVVYVLNSDFLDITVEPQLALVTAIEAFVISPRGNAITVISMEAVGRNL